jgi:hypothetical protein
MKIDSNWIQKQLSANAALTADQIEGEQYYRQKNPFIMGYKKVRAVTDANGTAIVNDWKASHKIPSGFFDILTDQKINYSVNADTTGKINGKDLTQVLGNSWIYDLQEAGIEATQKGYSVFQIYIHNGKVKRKKIPAEECTPCFEDGILVAMIRSYSAQNEKGQAVNRCEVWDSEMHYTAEQTSGADWVFLKEESHLVSSQTCGSL